MSLKALLLISLFGMKPGLSVAQRSFCVQTNKPTNQPKKTPQTQNKTNRGKKSFPPDNWVSLFFLDSKIERLNFYGVCWLSRFCTLSLWCSGWNTCMNFPGGNVIHSFCCEQCSDELLGFVCVAWLGCRTCASSDKLRWGVFWMLGEITENAFQGALLLPLRLFFWLNFSIKVSCRWSVMMRFAFAWGECTFFTVLCLFTYSNK